MNCATPWGYNMSAVVTFIDMINAQLDSGKVPMPVFNACAHQIQLEISKQDPDIRQLAKLIMQDQALTGHVLRIANSAFYRGLSEVTTVDNAIKRLGIKEVTNIVLLVTQKSNFASQDPFFKELLDTLWRHSVGCALGSFWLAKRLNLKELTQEAFFAGLLHDMGKLLILTVIDHLRETGKIDKCPTTEFINQVMRDLHPSKGHQLLTTWNLPQRYCEVVAQHHAERFDTKNHVLVMVRLADKTCNKMEIGLNVEPSMMLMATEEAAILGLSDVDLAELQVKIEDSLAVAGA